MISLRGDRFDGSTNLMAAFVAELESIGWDGEPVVYQFDPVDGLWRNVPPACKPIPTGGEMLAIAVVREAIRGDKYFWQGLAERMNRGRDGG